MKFIYLKGGLVMAFRILSDEEIALLDDKQRIQYEKQLKIYQQRVAFVEQIEAYENVHIPPYKPKLESIPVIDEIEVKSFRRPEYELSACEPIVKPKLQVKSFDVAEPIAPVLPILSKPQGVRIKNIKKIDNIQPKLLSVSKPLSPQKNIKEVKIEQPDLPTVAKLNIAVKSYRGSGEIKPNLPNVVKPITSTDFDFKPFSFEAYDIKAGIPKVSKPNIELSTFVLPEKESHNLPKVTIRFTEVKEYKKPEKVNTVLPQVTKPNVDIKYSKNEKPIQTNLPELNNISQVKVAFKKPEKPNVQLPEVIKPSANVRVLKKTDLTKPGLPKTSKVNMNSKSFLKPDIQTTALPTITKLQKEIKSFEKPDLQTPVLPTVAKLDLEGKSFDRQVNKALEQLQEAQTKFIVSAPPSVKIKPFVKIESKASALPDKVVVNIPDAYEKLKQLLPTTIKD